MRSENDTAIISHLQPRGVFPLNLTMPQEVFANPGKLRIGLLNRMPGSVEGQLDPACQKAAEDAGKLLESCGHHVELAHPPGIDDPQWNVTYKRLLSARGLHVLRRFEQRIGRKATSDEIEPATNSFLDIARNMSADDYQQELDNRNSFSRQFAGWWSKGFDILLTPSTGTMVPKLGTLGLDDARQVQMLRWSAFMRFYNFSGQPAISLPLYESEGLPLGIQLGAPYGREDLLISLAAQLEREKGWRERLPTVHST